MTATYNNVGGGAYLVVFFHFKLLFKADCSDLPIIFCPGVN